VYLSQWIIRVLIKSEFENENYNLNKDLEKINFTLNKWLEIFGITKKIDFKKEEIPEFKDG